MEEWWRNGGGMEEEWKSNGASMLVFGLMGDAFRAETNAR